MKYLQPPPPSLRLREHLGRGYRKIVTARRPGSLLQDWILCIWQGNFTGRVKWLNPGEDSLSVTVYFLWRIPFPDGRDSLLVGLRTFFDNCIVFVTACWLRMKRKVAYFEDKHPVGRVTAFELTLLSLGVSQTLASRPCLCYLISLFLGSQSLNGMWSGETMLFILV